MGCFRDSPPKEREREISISEESRPHRITWEWQREWKSIPVKPHAMEIN